MNVTSWTLLLPSPWMPSKQKVKLPGPLRLDPWATVIIEVSKPSSYLAVDWKKAVRFRPQIHKRP
jgi:hypothetical protein